MYFNLLVDPSMLVEFPSPIGQPCFTAHLRSQDVAFLPQLRAERAAGDTPQRFE